MPLLGVGPSLISLSLLWLDLRIHFQSSIWHGDTFFSWIGSQNSGSCPEFMVADHLHEEIVGSMASAFWEAFPGLGVKGA